MVKFVEAGTFADIEENDGSAVYEAAGRDGAKLCIFHRSVGAAGGHAGRFHRSGRFRGLPIRWRGLLFKRCRGKEQNQE